MKKNDIIENWVDIYAEDWAKLGNPVISISPLSTQEFNQELSAMISRWQERTEWMEVYQSTQDDWGYPVIEISPLTTEGFNRELQRMIFNEPEVEAMVRIPAIPTKKVLPKVS
ncbi:MAG: hypothetical protein ABRQ26_02355 [Syntrophomonadaceae bacterium]